MAETTNGIYYPNDGTQPADVLGDMKKMAESIDEAINDNKYDDTKIKEEQEKQNKSIEKNAENIEDNATDIQDLKAENANLRAQIPTGTASGEEISLQDSAEMELIEFGLQGNSKQETREGYNLIDVTTLSDEAKSKDISYDEGFYVKDNSPDSDNRAWSYSQCNWKDILLKAGTYTIALLFSTQIKNTGADKYLQVFDNNSSSIAVAEKSLITNKDVFVQEFTLSQETTIGIEIKAYDGIYRIMLLKGTYTTENLPNFEEYGAMPSLDYPSEVEAVGDSGSVEIIKSNKNLLDLNYRNANGITFDKNRITVVNPTSYNNGIDSKLIKNKFLCGKNISVKIISNGSVVSGYAPSLVISTNKDAYRFQKVYKVNNYNNEVTNITRQFSEDEYISGIQFYTNYSQGGTKCNLTIDVQIEISDESTEFIEHEGNTYTIPVQKPFLKGDYFIKEDNHWKEVHLREKRNIKDDIQNAVLSSTTNFIYVPNLLASTAFYKTNNDDVGIISNILRHASYNNMNNALVDYGIGISDVGSLVIRIKEFKTLEEYKNELNNENYYYYYPLRNPSKIECTREQTQVLEQIIKDGTYKEVTHFYTTEDLKPTIEVKYYKDLETLFNKQADLENTLNNVQAQILELGGN